VSAAGVVEDEGAIVGARVKATWTPPEDTDRSDLALASAREVIAALEGSAKLRVVALAAWSAVHRGIAGAAGEPLPALSGNCRTMSKSI